MTRDKIIEMAEILGAKEIRDTGEWIMFNCPFAPWTHSDGEDAHPSFGVIEDSISSYHCFACGVRGKLSVLPSALARLGHPRARELRRFVFLNEDPRQKPQKKGPVLLQPIDESILDRFKPFKKWGHINEESIRRWELRYDPKTQSIVFPVRDRFGRLVGIRRRFKDGSKLEDRSLTPVPLKKTGMWYGMHLIDLHRPIYLVEGERDAILLQQVGVNAMASLGASVTNAQIETLNELGRWVVCFFDNDEAGREATERIIKKVSCAVSKVMYWGVHDPAEAVEKGVVDKIIPEYDRRKG